LRPIADDRFDPLQDDDMVAVEVPVRWSRWGRSARRSWQSIEAFSGRLAAQNTRLWAVSFVAAWAAYGMYVGGQYRAILDEGAASLGFGLAEVEIRGLASADMSPITDRIAPERHQSLLAVDAEALRSSIADLPWVSDVSVEKIYPGKLVVRLAERRPYALWQDDGRVHVVDQSGSIMTDQIEERHLKLPLVVGQGANTRAGEALDLISSAPALKDRIHAAVLVAERRWNLVTNEGVELKLPEENAGAALAEIGRLQSSKRLLDRDIEAVDLRAPDRVFIKLSDAAAAQRRDMLKAKAKKKGADT
jgi:cell division protein FtsQ